MKSKRKARIKSPERLSREINDICRHAPSDNSLPLAVFDTGGLIDIVQSTRQYDLTHRGESSDSVWGDASKFLSSFDCVAPIYICPEVLEETTKHYNTLLSGDRREIPKNVLQDVLGFAGTSLDIMEEIRGTYRDDDIRYVAHWISKFACSEDSKKQEEGFGDADKAILFSALKLVGGFLYKSKANTCGKSIITPISKSLPSEILMGRIDLKPVIVVSSDKHVISGVNFINGDTELKEKYPGVVPVSTRTY